MTVYRYICDLQR